MNCKKAKGSKRKGNKTKSSTRRGARRKRYHGRKICKRQDSRKGEQKHLLRAETLRGSVRRKTEDSKPASGIKSY
jgi:hypothetical protein